MNKACLFIGLFVLLCLDSALGQQSLPRSFEEFLVQVNRLETQKDYPAALQLTQDAWEAFPDHEFELMKEQIYLHEKMEAYSKNLSVWAAGHRKGYFFLLDKRMKKYEPYLKWAAFDTLARTDAALRTEAMSRAKTVCRVIHSASHQKKGDRCGLLLLLHGGGSNLEKAQSRWKIIPSVMDNYIVVLVQSYRHYDSNTFGWLSSDTRGHEEFRQCVQEIMHQFPIDTTRIILGGTSAGGSMALTLALNHTIPVRGVIGFCPGMPQLLPAPSKTPPIKVFMVGGEEDFYLEKQIEFTHWLDGNKVPYRHLIIPGMGHDFPSEYETLIRQAFEFIE